MGPSCSADFFIRLRLRGASSRLCQRTEDGAARKIDLEGVVLKALGVPQHEVRSPGEGRLAGGLPAQHGFCRRVAPRLVCDSSERQTRLCDRVAAQLQSDRDRDERKRVGQAIPDFQVV